MGLLISRDGCSLICKEGCRFRNSKNRKCVVKQFVQGGAGQGGGVPDTTRWGGHAPAPHGRFDPIYSFFLIDVYILFVQRLHLFLSRYAELFEVDVFCDGCKSPLTRSRYRCLNCFEIDLCATCYNGKHSPNILTLCSSSEGAEGGGGVQIPFPAIFLDFYI